MTGGDPDTSQFSKNWRAAYDLVPEIGKGRRWYDYPDKISRWARDSRLGRRLPNRSRSLLFRFAFYFHPWNERDRQRVWSRDDPGQNLIVPEGEHVRIPSLWVVDFCPPSLIAVLADSFAATEMDKSAVLIRGEEEGSSRKMLERSRRRYTRSWFRFGVVANKSSPNWYPDAVRRKMPKEFSYVELTAKQIGPGLTAVRAKFYLSEIGQGHVDRVWWSDHEPEIVHERGERRRSLDRLWSGYRRTQAARAELHAMARMWMKDHCAGEFAESTEPQPLFDLILFDKLDPSEPGHMDRQTQDAIRAIGVVSYSFERIESPQLPGIVLTENDRALTPGIRGRSTRAFIGQIEKVSASVSDVTGGDAVANIEHAVEDIAERLMFQIALVDYLDLKQAQVADLRDSARVGHEKFRKRDIVRLRKTLLTHSVDISSLHRDVGEFIAYVEKWGHYTTFHRNIEGLRAASKVVERRRWDRRGKLPSRVESTDHESIDDYLIEALKKQVKELREFDHDYRDILSTVASLGASIDSFKVQRYALGIALISLFVALVTLVVTAIGPEGSEPSLRALWHWLTGMSSKVWPW